MNTRAIALENLIQVVVHGKSLSHLPAAGMRDPNLDSSFIQAIYYGVCRSFFRLDYILQMLLEKPLKPKDHDIYCLLLMGLYQLSEMRVAKHAAVSESVSLTKHLKKEWAKGLVNAVLRNFERRQTELIPEIEKNFSARYSHPKWMIARFKKDWPDEWIRILNANNAHPPFSLRWNVRHHSTLPPATAWGEVESGVVSVIPHTPSGIILKTPMNVSELPGFAEGDISVQDGAAQLAPDLLIMKKNDYVLDACAAPGGKTAHILETADVELVAIDKDAKRLKLIEENLSRLQLSAKCIVADVAQVTEWWDGRLFDRILLDAPCSASGVIRRHPDIKILRQDQDIAKLAAEQLRLLQAIWPILKPDGILVYATCSIFSDENSAIIEKFLQQTSDAIEEKIDAEWGLACRYGRQILPGMNEMDGFYYSRLRKVS